MRPPGRPLHLVKRFFGSITARPLAPRDQAFVAALLSTDERVLFWSQSPADQRHAADGARMLLTRAPARSDLAAAVLLHDVGKRHAALGVIGRSLASLAALAHIPTRGRWARYLEHPRAGSVDLQGVHSDPVAITFARDHHGSRANAIAPADWVLLKDADDA